MPDFVAFKEDNFLPDGLPLQKSQDILETAKLLFNKPLPSVSKKSKRFVPQRLKEVINKKKASI
jgi:hypothetical protein